MNMRTLVTASLVAGCLSPAFAADPKSRWGGEVLYGTVQGDWNSDLWLTSNHIPGLGFTDATPLLGPLVFNVHTDFTTFSSYSMGKASSGFTISIFTDLNIYQSGKPFEGMYYLIGIGGAKGNSLQPRNANSLYASETVSDNEKEYFLYSLGLGYNLNSDFSAEFKYVHADIPSGVQNIAPLSCGTYYVCLSYKFMDY